MGRYIDWDDVVDRYPSIDTIGGADTVSSTYVVYAESFLDSILSTHFATPFSQEVMMIKDLAIDCVFWRAAQFKLDNAIEVKSNFFETIKLLKDGQMIMVDVNGNEIEASASISGYWSSTQSYTPAFGMDDPVDWEVDPDWVQDDRDSRS